MEKIRKDSFKPLPALKSPLAVWEQPRLSIDRRIMKFVLLGIFCVLVIPLFVMKWSNVKRLGLEVYDGIDRTPLQKQGIKTERSAFTRFCDYLTMRDQLIAMDNAMREHSRLLRRENLLLRRQLNKFDSFVMNNAELYNVCLTHMQQFPEYISPAPEIPKNLDFNNPISLRSSFLFEKINLDHRINERKRFFMRHPEVMQAFQRAFDMQKAKL